MSSGTTFSSFVSGLTIIFDVYVPFKYEDVVASLYEQSVEIPTSERFLEAVVFAPLSDTVADVFDSDAPFPSIFVCNSSW